MSGNVLFLLELLSGSGIVLGIAIWELISLKRDRRRREQDERGVGDQR
ncbi:MAG: hypothetical protein ABI794_13060 [Betaproteobacteria bacterium]